MQRKAVDSGIPRTLNPRPETCALFCARGPLRPRCCVSLKAVVRCSGTAGGSVLRTFQRAPGAGYVQVGEVVAEAYDKIKG